MSRRKFTREFKEEAVLLVKQSGTSISEIARNLGLNDNVLRRWVKEYAETNTKNFPGHGNSRDEELSRLKKELLQVKKERDFLREAAAYFAKGST
jgi:transposase